jgi:hypothetical protein
MHSNASGWFRYMEKALFAPKDAAINESATSIARRSIMV